MGFSETTGNDAACCATCCTASALFIWRLYLENCVGLHTTSDNNVYLIDSIGQLILDTHDASVLGQSKNARVVKPENHNRQAGALSTDCRLDLQSSPHGLGAFKLGDKLPAEVHPSQRYMDCINPVESAK